MPDALGNILNLRALTIALPLIAGVLLLGYFFAKRGKTRRKKPGQYLQYTVAGQTAAGCRSLLGTPTPEDIFSYTLEGAPSGGWYIHFTMHSPTQQPLDTLFLLQFEGDDPALFSLQFVREAFGMREPVIGEALLDDFFAQKLGAARLRDSDEGRDT